MNLKEFCELHPDAVIYLRESHENHFVAEQVDEAEDDEFVGENDVHPNDTVVLGNEFKGQFISFNGDEYWVVL